MRHSLATLAACGLLGAFLPSCASPDDPNAAEVRMSGVGVIAEGCSPVARLASGVVVGHRDRVVTVAHAIAGATSISIVDHAGNSHTATVRAFDKDRDLAVLEVDGLSAPPLQLAASDLVSGYILTWSREHGVTSDDVTVTKQFDLTIEDIYVEEIAERRGLEVLGDIAVGDSGGAVLSSTGDVMGIIYARSRVRDTVGFATDASEVAQLLETLPAAQVDNGRCR